MENLSAKFQHGHENFAAETLVVGGAQWPEREKTVQGAYVFVTTIHFPIFYEINF